MGRELRRVPMDFDYPMKRVWYGYLCNYVTTCKVAQGVEWRCENCRKFAEIKGIPLDSAGCPDYDKYLAEPIRMLKELLEVPKGEGYQLWSTTSEGEPMSPVFASLEELCEWCEENATVFAWHKTSKEGWMQMLSEGGIAAHIEGNNVFL